MVRLWTPMMASIHLMELVEQTRRNLAADQCAAEELRS